VRIHRLKVENYRVLRKVSFQDLTPLTVLCGANGSGKSTVFDVFAFLKEAFTQGLRPAWDARNRIDSIRSRGQSGPVAFEIAYKARGFDQKERKVTYRLELDQDGSLPVVASEVLRWSTAPGPGRPTNISEFKRGKGAVYDEESGQKEEEELASPDLLAVSAQGQFQAHPRVKALRDFIQGWYLSYVSADGTRATPNAGPEPRLTKTGDNLANVIQFLQENHPARLRKIFEIVSERVPQLESVLPTRLDDGRLLLRLKDRAFAEPVLARFASDGTLKLLAYLIVFHDPDPPAVIGIEEPENQLHPKLLSTLAEEVREVSGRSQTLVTTHSPEFLTTIRPRELWAIGRGDDGFAEPATITGSRPWSPTVRRSAISGLSDTCGRPIRRPCSGLRAPGAPRRGAINDAGAECRRSEDHLGDIRSSAVRRQAGSLAQAAGPSPGVQARAGNGSDRSGRSRLRELPRAEVAAGPSRVGRWADRHLGE
jgi:predicted ATPase